MGSAYEGVVNRAVVFTGPDAVEMRVTETPRLTENDVLIATRLSLISAGTEMSVLTGAGDPGSEWQNLRRYPYLAGYSNVGTVIDVGKDVPREWLGHRVSSHGSHATVVAVKESELRRIPDDVRDDEAIFTTLAEVAMNGLRRANLTWGENVAIIGMGVLGQITARIARFAGAMSITCLDTSPSRLAALPPDPEFLRVAVDEASADVGGPPALSVSPADLVIEASGNPVAIPMAARIMRTGGRLLILSSPTGATQFDFHDLCNRISCTIIGAHFFSHPPHPTPDNPWTAVRHGDLFLECLRRRVVTVDELVSRHIPSANAHEAYSLLATERASTLGVALDWLQESSTV